MNEQVGTSGKQAENGHPDAFVFELDGPGEQPVVTGHKVKPRLDRAWFSHNLSGKDTVILDMVTGLWESPKEACGAAIAVTGIAVIANRTRGTENVVAIVRTSEDVNLVFREPEEIFTLLGVIDRWFDLTHNDRIYLYVPAVDDTDGQTLSAIKVVKE